MKNQETDSSTTKTSLLDKIKNLQKKSLIGIAAGLIVVIALAGGWQYQIYLENKRIIKSEDEPAAQLLRDDDAKPKDPKLFLRLDHSVSSYTKDEENYAYAELTLRIDEGACRDYYGRDGVTQCKNNWHFLNAEQEGWSISPKVEGKWSFREQNERYIARFDFNQDYLKSSQEYALKAPATRKLGKNIELAEYKAVFSTAPFEFSVSSWAFRVDPQDPKRCVLTGQVTTPYPFEPKSFESKLNINTDGAYRIGTPKITYSADGRTAVINADVLLLPRTSMPARIEIAPGVKRKNHSDITKKTASSGTTVSGQDVFVSLSNAQAIVTTDDDLLSRQVLTLEFTRPVKVIDVHQNIKALRMPAYASEDDRKKKRKANWKDYAVNSKAVQTAIAGPETSELDLDPIYTPDEYSTVVSFLFSSPPGYFYLEHVGGAGSLTPYRLAPFSRIMSVPVMESELRIMQDGNILSLNASKTLAILSRKIDLVELEAWRVRPQYINLLASQSSNILAETDLNDWYDSSIAFSDISEKIKISYKPTKIDGKEPDYHALDLSPLLKGGGKGLFRINLKGRTTNYSSLESYRSTFLLVTDIAMNVKMSSDGARQVFISSFASGKPLAGGKVEIIGRNGLPVFSKACDASGMVKIPPVDDFTHEKAPVAIVAHHGNDYTYMPLKDYSRKVSYSDHPSTFGKKIDVGGMAAFVFAERGIFRPGEELRFGALIKAADWDNSKFTNMPVRAVLTNPRGTIVYDKQHQQDPTGLIDITIPMQETDPTGRYHLDIIVAKNLLGSTQAQVEEFQPDNLKVIAGFNKIPPVGQKKGWVLPKDLKALISVENLYGTAAVGNRVDLGFSITPTRLAFKEYGEYQFYDPGEDVMRQQGETQRGETDEKGEVEFDLDLKSFANGSFFMTIEAEAFETGGGRGVTSIANALVSPHEVLVGWKSDARLSFLAKDSDATVDFIAINNNLERTTLPELTLSVNEIEYVASLIKDNNGRYRYDKVRRLKEVETSNVTVDTEGLSINLPTNSTGEYELSLKAESGLTLCNFSYVVAGGSQRRFGLERDATLRIHLDKQEYQAGEDMKIFISAPYAGNGLITLESDTVLAHKWFSANTSDSVQSIKVPKDYEGRAFVNVAMVRDITSDAVHSTPFTYAVAPFIANIEQRNIKLKVESPDLVMPGDILYMTVRSEKPGKAIVFAVNEGILQLTGFKTPSPINYFLQQNPLSVSTMQNWDMIMPEYYLMNMAAFGGDMALDAAAPGQLNPFRRKAEPSVVYWSGPIDVDAGGTNLEWEVPSYFNGSLRIMAVGAGLASIGESSRSTTVRGPLIITPDLPVAVAPGDEFEVTAAIANNIENSGSGLKVDVNVELDEGLEFVRKPEASISIDEGREGKATFRLKATKRLGESIVKITATTQFEGEPTEVKRPISLSVRPASPRMSSFKAGFVKEKEQTINTGRELYPEFAEVEASLSGLPLPMMDGLSGFLTRFPYGCTEQILSAAFPYAALHKSPELLPVPRGMSPADLKRRSEKAIQKGLVTLQERQVIPGRFSLWPYESNAYSYLTVYGLDYLLSAQEAGFDVPQDLIKNARQETLSLLQGAPRSLEAMRTMAYAAWVYTRSGERYTGLPRLVKELDANIKDWRSMPSAALIAACYQMMHQDEEASKLIKGIKAIDPGKKAEWGYSGWFYSRLWDNSLYLSMLSRYFPEKLEDNEGKKALVYVINDISTGYYTTSSAAQAVRAISDYAAAHMGQNTNLKLNALNANKEVLPVEAVGQLVKRLSMGSEAHAFRFAGAEGLYWQITTDGFDLKPQDAQAKKLIVKTEYIPVNGKKLEELEQGDDVYVLLRASASENIDNVAITALIPGGFEMVISKGGQIVGGGTSGSAGNEEYYDDEDDYEESDYDDSDSRDWNMNAPTAYPNQARMREVREMLREAEIPGSPLSLVHVERREDRSVVYTSLSKEEKLYIFRIKAINKGKFTLPSTFAEALYDPDARANTGAGIIEVK